MSTFKRERVEASFSVENLWNETDAHNITDELDLLAYRSRLLGTDRRVCNWKGGNTSTKCVVTNVAGQPERVIYVKASGFDMATIDRAGFAGLRLDHIEPLIEREQMTDEEMVDYLLRCVIHPDMPRQSIETLLHAFIPFDYVDHTHPDSIIALATTDAGEQIAHDLFGDRIAWVPYIRPGFTLAKQIGLIVRENPRLEGIMMAKHGLVTWGHSAKECYDTTIRIINEAAEMINSRMTGQVFFGGTAFDPLPDAERIDTLAALLPPLRGLVSQNRRMILHVDDSPEVLDFVSSKDAKQLALTGAACPDHLVHTKYQPLVVSYDPQRDDTTTLIARLDEQIQEYAKAYEDYVSTWRQEGDAYMADPYPRIILIPALGLIATGPDKSAAENAAGLFRRAIEVMRGASILGRYTSMTPQEAYDVEYWPLELYKLTLAPPEKELSGHVALVTGAAGGIGRATALKLAEAGSHVVVADIDQERARHLAEEINTSFGPGKAISASWDVTDENAVIHGFQQCILTYGGIDILVSNAGIAMAKPIEKTTTEEWERLFKILSTGYFLVSKEAARHMKAQKIGGSIIFVTSKNAVVASSGAAAYNAAKASSLHLARSLAEELGRDGIRVNSVAPDAVLAGSAIWSSTWRKARAAEYGISPDQLEEHYRGRTTLRVNVFPEDVAEAILFFASGRSTKTTGCTITVDGGVQAAYMR